MRTQRSSERTRFCSGSIIKAYGSFTQQEPKKSKKKVKKTGEREAAEDNEAAERKLAANKGTSQPMNETKKVKKQEFDEFLNDVEQGINNESKTHTNQKSSADYEKEREQQKRAEDERLTKEKAAKDREAFDRAEREKADLNRGDKEKADMLEKEKAAKTKADLEKAEKERLEKEKANQPTKKANDDEF